MGLRGRILSALALDPKELQPLALLTLTNFFIMLGYVVAKTVRDAELLARFDLEKLPYIYIAIAVLLILLFGSFTWLRDRIPVTRLLLVTNCAIVAVLGAFYFILRGDSNWAPPLFYIWVNVFGAVIFTQFWLCFHTLTAARGARRLITVVAGGALIGQIAGGQLASLLARGPLQNRTEALIGIVIAALIASLFTMLRVIRVWGGSPPNPDRTPRLLAPREPSPGRPRSPLQEIVSRRYLRAIGLFICIGLVAGTVVDFLFKVSVQNAIPAESLTGFFGVFYTLVGVAALVVQLVVTPILLQNIGIGSALLALPVLLLGVGGVAVAQAALATFVLAKGLDAGLRGSVLKSSVELLYMPLNPHLRRRIKPTLDAVSERLGDALGGVVILVGLRLGLGTSGLAVLLVGLVLIWFVWGWRARIFYVRTLRSRLQPPGSNRLPGAGTLEDVGGLEPLLRLLNSADDQRVLRALELFAAYDKVDVIPAVLLAHRDAAVRLHTLRIFRDGRRSDYFEFLGSLLRDTDRRVQQLALVTLADADPHFALTQVKVFAEATDPGTRAGYAYTLLKLGGGEERERGLALLDELRRGAPRDRLAVARTLGRSSERLPFVWLQELLRDPDSEVRAAAAEAAGRRYDRELVEPLCDLLYSRRTAEPARRALIRAGDGAVPDLLAIFASRDAGWLRLQIIELLREIGSQAATDALLACLDVQEERMSTTVLQALVDLSCGPRRRSVAREPVRAALSAEVARVRFYLGRLETLRRSPASRRPLARLLIDLVRERADGALQACFQCLELLHPGRELCTAFDQYRDGDPQTRATAVAFLDAVLPQPYRRMLLDFLENIPLEQKLMRAGIEPPASVVIALRSLLVRTDPLMQAVTLAAGQDFGCADRLSRQTHIDTRTPWIVREAAALAGVVEV
jgi:AAA family ATP:ADP antiporter